MWGEELSIGRRSGDLVRLLELPRGGRCSSEGSNARGIRNSPPSASDSVGTTECRLLRYVLAGRIKLSVETVASQLIDPPSTHHLEVLTLIISSN